MTFFLGFHSRRFTSIQAQHDENTNSQRSAAVLWSACLIEELWTMLHAMWIHRNEALHDSPVIHNLNGLTEATTAANPSNSPEA